MADTRRRRVATGGAPPTMTTTTTTAAHASATTPTSRAPFLLGILLVVSTLDGPQVAFHYPQEAYAPSSRQARFAAASATTVMTTSTASTTGPITRPGPHSKLREQIETAMLSASLPSSPATDGAAEEAPYRYDSPDEYSGDESSGFTSSASWSSSSSLGGYSGGAALFSASGSEYGHSSEDVDIDALDLEDAGDLASAAGQNMIAGRTMLRNVAKTLDIRPTGEIIPGVANGMAGEATLGRGGRRRRRRRRRQSSSDPLFPIRHRSVTPGRSPQTRVPLGGVDDTVVSTNVSYSSYHRRNISPSVAARASPRLAAYSETSMLSPVIVPDLSLSLRSPVLGASRAPAATPVSHKGSIDQGGHSRKPSAATNTATDDSSDTDDSADDNASRRDVDDAPLSSSTQGHHGGGSEWNKCFGYTTDFLAPLLCPQRSMCDVMFEFTANETAFLGHPVHVRADGKWKRSIPTTVSASAQGSKDARYHAFESMSATSITVKSTSESERWEGRSRSRHEILDGREADYYSDDMEEEEEEEEEEEVEEEVEALNMSYSSIGFGSQASSSRAPSEVVAPDADEDTSFNINSISHAFQSGIGARNFVVSQTTADSDTQATGSDDAVTDGTHSLTSSQLLDPSSISKRGSRAPSASGSEHALNMFHVVFVMDPPELEYNDRIKAMYDYIVVPLAERLRYEQYKSNYVMREVEIMQRLRTRAAESGISSRVLWEETLKTSSLALALAQLYSALSHNAIANISINNVTRSFQIPVQLHSAVLPSILEPVKVPGFYLSTEESLRQFEIGPSGSSSSEIHSAGENLEQEGLPFLEHALLLLDSVDRIMKVIAIDPGSRFGIFLRAVTPTDPISAIAKSTHLSLKEVEDISRHLIYWRRARIIIPIHRRGIYSVAPTAPLTYLPSHAKSFRRAFPNAPSLPRILHKFSAQEPRPLANIIPSPDLRDMYYEILAWLLRLGYLAQMHTYIWIRVAAHVKQEVARDEERAAAIEGGDADDDDEDLISPYPTDAEPPQLPTVASPLPTDDTGNFKGSILKLPGRPTAEEQKWMAKMVQGMDRDMATLFWKTREYMTGKVSFEDVPRLAGIQRKELRTLLTALKPHIIIARHW
ncbi:nitrogen permease regulator of amino acid transport activity 3-domain-containing protein [Limtongia smithiae]|uniref:nitrogen permease regulator of amino acid transport activity 3-domain-containing protein n=1 Tax=Limtongia smithiae TaxID=1125753 RepID=UPI0034CD90D4